MLLCWVDEKYAWMGYFFDSLQTWLGVCRVYINSSIVDEGALIETSPLQDQGLIHPNCRLLDQLGVSNAIFGVQNLKNSCIHTIK